MALVKPIFEAKLDCGSSHSERCPLWVKGMRRGLVGTAGLSFRRVTRWGSLLPQAWGHFLRLRGIYLDSPFSNLAGFLTVAWAGGAEVRVIQAVGRKARRTFSRGAIVRKKASRDQLEAGITTFWVSERSSLLVGSRDTSWVSPEWLFSALQLRLGVSSALGPFQAQRRVWVVGGCCTPWALVR